MLERFLCAAVGLVCLPACASTGKTVAVSGHVILVDEYSVDGSQDESVSGYGVEGHVLLLGPDISLGYEKREIADEDVDELFVGARFFLIDSPIVSPYVSLRLRHSADGFDAPGSDSYTGWAAGAGAYVWFLGPAYLDVNVHYEALFRDPDVGGVETGFEGILGSIGLGVTF